MKLFCMRLLILMSMISTCFACTSSQQKSNNIEETYQLTDSISIDQPHIVKSELNPQIAVDFINSYVENENKRKQAVDIREWIKSSDLVTEDFKTELNKIVTEAIEKEPNYGLGFNPILNAQDYPEEGFLLSSYDSISNIAIVAGKNWSSFVLKIKLTNQAGQTLIEGCGIVNMPKEQ